MPSVVKSLLPMTLAAIRELDEAGVSIDWVEDFSEILELNELASGVANPRPGELTDAVLDYPFEAGGVKFRALTIAARIWLRDFAIPALENDPVLESAAVPFAMANRNDLWALTDSHLLRKAVRMWVVRDCKQLTDAMLRNMLAWFGLIGPSEADEDCGPVPDEYGNVIAMLTREYAGKPEYWLFEAPPEMVRACVADVILKAHFEHEAHTRSAAKSRGKGGGLTAVAPDPNSPSMQAQLEFNDRLRKFKARKLNRRADA